MVAHYFSCFFRLSLIFIIFGSVFIFLGLALYLVGFLTAIYRKGWHKTIGVIDSHSALFKGIANSFPKLCFEMDGKEYVLIQANKTGAL